VVSSHQNPTGQFGRVTGKIAPGEVGEVSLPFNGGTQAYHAYAIESDQTLLVGTRVTVVDFDPPITVYVQPFYGVT
jgi:hypothetical protein